MTKQQQHTAAAAAKLLQSCPTLWDPVDGSPPGSPIPGILQARTPEWVAISFSNAWKWKGKVKSLSHVWLLATPWTAAHQAPPSMEFSRQEYWSGVPLPSPNNILEDHKNFSLEKMHTQSKRKERKGRKGEKMDLSNCFVITFFNNSDCSFGDSSLLIAKVLIVKFWNEIGYQRILIHESSTRQVFQNISV